MDDIKTIVEQNQSLIPQSSTNEQKLTTQLSKTPSLKWPKVMEVMALDKRHDLAGPVVLLWKAKLSKYDDDEICEFFQLYSGEFFPSVDDAVRFIDRRRERVAEQKAERDWKDWKTANQITRDTGLMATKEQISEAARQVEETWRNSLAMAQSRALGQK